MDTDIKRIKLDSKSKEDIKNKLSKIYADPCKVYEVVQIAQGVSSDAIKEYHKTLDPIIVSLSLQIETLKELLFKSEISRVDIGDGKEEEICKNSILDKDLFTSIFEKKVKSYNEEKSKFIRSVVEKEKSNTMKPSGSVSMESKVNSVEVETIKK